MLKFNKNIKLTRKLTPDETTSKPKFKPAKLNINKKKSTTNEESKHSSFLEDSKSLPENQKKDFLKGHIHHTTDETPNFILGTNVIVFNI